MYIETIYAAGRAKPRFNSYNHITNNGPKVLQMNGK